jgi:long-subunit acyl-CoA synthetase (AMP-forming)
VGTSWTIAGLLRDLAARGQAPAVIASGEQDVVIWDCAGLAARAADLASNLLAERFGRGVPTALWAPNSPLWISAALGILAAGGVLVSVDDQANAAEVEAVLRRSKARVLLTTEEHRQSCIVRNRDLAAGNGDSWPGHADFACSYTTATLARSLGSGGIAVDFRHDRITQSLLA